MAKRQIKSQPTWTDLKAKLTSFDRAGLLSLIQDLYAARKENQAFLHARFDLGEDVLEPYKQTIDRWLWPDVLRRQDTSVTKALQAISDYKKAAGEQAGLAELMVFYCEQGAGFSSDLGNEDESYLNSLARMFEQALMVAKTLPESDRDAVVARLDRVREVSHTIGYGVADYMDSVLARYTRQRDSRPKNASPRRTSGLRR